MDIPVPRPLSHAAVALQPLAEDNREGLRAATAADGAIWAIYPYSLLGDGFDRWWQERFGAAAEWRMYTIHDGGHDGGTVIGMTGFWPDRRNPGVVEVGASYLVPAARGSGLNRTVKWLLLSELFAHGIHRVEFHIDTRNGRSLAAALKIGARLEGVLRHHKRTHTGFVRDTALLAILDCEWPQLEARLRPPAGEA